MAVRMNGHFSCVNIVRFLYSVVIVFAAILAWITLNSFYPVADPITSVGLVDKISLFLGIHDESGVLVLELDTWSCTLYTYIFHRRIYDGTFHVAQEKKQQLPGLFAVHNDSLLDHHISDLLDLAHRQLDVQHHVLLTRPEMCHVENCKTPLVARISPDALASVSRRDISRVAAAFQKNLEKSDFIFSQDGFVGRIMQEDERILKWFSINLLTHNLQKFVVGESAVVIDVGQVDLNLTFAVSGLQLAQMSKSRLSAVKRMMAFGHHITIVTVTYPGLGLYCAREQLSNSTALPATDSAETIDVRHACINPICDSIWMWQGKRYRVRGLEKGDFQVVKERNGPFAGKKINRPVANYDFCHDVFRSFVAEKLNRSQSDEAFILKLIKTRPVFMEGLLKEKCIERGLSLPFLGGSVKMKAFLDSLKHACEVPNTEQPFACADMMFMANLLDHLMGLNQALVLHTTGRLNNMTADWPLAVAFYVYQNGLG